MVSNETGRHEHNLLSCHLIGGNTTKSQNPVTQPGLHPHSMLITSIVEMTSLNEGCTIMGQLACISMFPASKFENPCISDI